MASIAIVGVTALSLSAAVFFFGAPFDFGGDPGVPLALDSQSTPAGSTSGSPPDTSLETSSTSTTTDPPLSGPTAPAGDGGAPTGGDAGDGAGSLPPPEGNTTASTNETGATPKESATPPPATSQTGGSTDFAAPSSSAGSSLPSQPIPEITLTVVPGPGVGQVTLTWDLPPSIAPEDVTMYSVERGASLSGTTDELVRTGALTYVDSTATPGATYYYQVRAEGADGALASSPTVAAVAYPGGSSLPTPELGSLMLTSLGLAGVALAMARRR